jgi:signal transduction histidine kinase
MMFRSISVRLISIFIVIIFVGFSIAGGLLYYFLSDFLSDEKADTLKTIAGEINTYMQDFIEVQDNALAQVYLVRMLDFYSNNSNSIIFITDSVGNIVYSSPDISTMPAAITSKIDDGTGKYRLPDKEQYDDALSGKDVREIGFYYGLFADTGYTWLTIAEPLKYLQDDGSEKIIGVVLLNSPLPGIAEARGRVIRFYIISMLVSAVISIILVYIFSRRVTKPLTQIRNAAKTIAGGDFSKRLQIISKDEIGELAAAFNQMAEALKNIEEMRRGFIANVSHELRTPLTSINGFIEGVLDGTIVPEKQSYYLSIAKEETLRLSRLISDLLDLARMESGEAKIELSNFEINELIRRCIIKLEKSILEKEIEVEALFGEEETFVNADADAIERVIINLLHNAVKFSKKKGRIRVITETGKERVTVSVEDEGEGIKPEEVSLIWERFYKSDKSRSNDRSGTGLGLAISRNLINEHNQTIWVESEYGKGSRFSFTLERTKNPKIDN